MGEQNKLFCAQFMRPSVWKTDWSLTFYAVVHCKTERKQVLGLSKSAHF